MFGLSVRFDLRPGAGESFDRLIAEIAPLIASEEPGTFVYATHTVEDEPDGRVFYELYRDREAFEDHEQKEHIRRFLLEREQYLVRPPRVEFLRLVSAKVAPNGVSR
jgi:quinol monooxygenase YgiN